MSDFPAVTWKVFSFPYIHVKFLTLHQANTIVLRVMQQLCFGLNYLLLTLKHIPEIKPHSLFPLNAPLQLCAFMVNRLRALLDLFVMFFLFQLLSALSGRSACHKECLSNLILNLCSFRRLHIHIVTIEHLAFSPHGSSQAHSTFLCSLNHRKNSQSQHLRLF